MKFSIDSCKFSKKLILYMNKKSIENMFLKLSILLIIYVIEIFNF